MGKKSKDPGHAIPDTVPGSDSSTVFSKLFGHAPSPEPDAPTSLFSAHNPFRRKHGEDPSQLDKELADQNPNDAGVELSKKDKKKEKKKRTKEEIEVVDDGKGSGDVVGVEKSKKGIPGSPMVTSDGKEKKQKRKRDELEREYEEKKYGATAGNEESKKVVVGMKRKSAENPAEMTVSKEGYDDENKLLRTIFVGNLPLKTKKKALLKEFSQFGEVESVRLRSVPTLDSKKPKKVMIMNNKINEAVDSVNAYVVFETEESAEASLAHNMALVGGNHIRVDRACPPRKKLKGDSTPLYDTKRTVFVGNLPFDVKDEELYRLFCGINQVGTSIEAIRVIRDTHTSVGKGIAYVMLKTKEAANIIVKRRGLKLRDRELRISHAKADSTPAKRKTPPFDGSENSSGKKLQLEPKTPNSGYRPRVSASASYEGARATKTGKEKKPYRKVTQPVVLRSASKGKDEPKQRENKRPSVAARKAKANALRTGGNGSSQAAGKKRKFGNRTPQSSFNKNKKARKSK
ncbi:hypothetical protein V2J09_014800 [Rumex salicifolius]